MSHAEVPETPLRLTEGTPSGNPRGLSHISNQERVRRRSNSIYLPNNKNTKKFHLLKKVDGFFLPTPNTITGMLGRKQVSKIDKNLNQCDLKENKSYMCAREEKANGRQ